MTIADPVAQAADSSEPSHISAWEAADLVGLLPYEIYELCSAGLIASVEWGDTTRVDLDSLRAYAPRLGRSIP